MPLLERAEAETGVRTPVTLADAGYFAGRHLEASEQRGQRVAMPDLARPLDDPYHKDRFDYDEESDSYRCPRGERLHFAGPKNNKGVPTRLYRVASASISRRCAVGARFNSQRRN